MELEIFFEAMFQLAMTYVARREASGRIRAAIGFQNQAHHASMPAAMPVPVASQPAAGAVPVAVATARGNKLAGQPAGPYLEI